METDLCLLQEANIEALILKGLFFLTAVYHFQENYLMGDIDLLIKPEQFQQFDELMQGCGYSQRISLEKGVLYSIEPDEINNSELSHYEYSPYLKVVEIPELNPYIDFINVYLLHGHPSFLIENNQVYLGLKIDPHHNLSFDIQVEDIWAAPQPFMIDDVVCQALSNEVFGWFIPARFYHEVMVFANHRLKLLADFIAFLSVKNVNYSTVLAMAEKYCLQPSLYYVYWFIKDFIELYIPDDFIAALDQSISMSESYRDWGDFLPKLLNKRVLFDVYLDK
ncbi:MAG: nucleotidyltransferase family protein [Firmicutes bacterium]|nr:nucleotidyltransferase family protein [Bacillota bacterium]